MPAVTRRSRVIDAAPAAIWRIVGDPYRMPMWWPKTARVEGVDADGWTSVLTTDKGRAIRADYTITASEEARRREWEQELAGTPFEQLFASVRYEVVLDPVDDGRTNVTITFERGVRGWSRFGGFLMRNAARRQLDEALDALTESVIATS